MRRPGFVLVAVLWLLIALSAVALHAGLGTEAQRLAAANQLDAARAREAALAGGEYARSRLTAAVLERAEELRAQVARSGASPARSRRLLRAALRQDDPWADPAGLLQHVLSFGDAQFRVDASDTGMRLNINRATSEMLLQFLAQGLRLDYMQADRLTQAILDWRDEDDLPRINGAERDEYLAAGAAVLPPNRPFERVAELRHVAGMTPELFARIEPHVTVSGSGRINVNAAAEPVLLAVPTFSPAAVAELLRWRSAGEYARSTSDLIELLGAAYGAPPEGQDLRALTRSVSFATNEVEVVATGQIEGSAVSATVRAVMVRAESGAMLVSRRIE